MKRNIFKIMTVLAVTMLMLPNAFAFWNFGDMVDSVKEKVGMKTSKDVALEKARAQATQERSAQAGSNGNGQLMIQNRNQVQVTEQTQNRIRAKLTKHVNMLDKAALIGRDNECRNNGGTWVFNDTVIGCQGVDSTTACGNWLVGKAKDKCEKVGGNFTCGTEGLFCTA